MTTDLGRYGIFLHRNRLTPSLAKEIEDLGFGTVWIGGSPPADLELPEALLEATERLVVATGIVNVWVADAGETAASYHRLEERHPGRFLLGIGIGHPEAIKQYRSPYQTLVDYLAALDRAGVPKERRVLAALGPKVLKLSAEQTAGAHPYLTTPEHTRLARELIGAEALLAPEQKILFETDAERARAIARPFLSRYLQLSNYVANLRRLGWTDADVASGGSDALIDALAVHGDPETVKAGLTAHLDAGGDHISAHILTEDDADYLPALRRLSETLDLR